VICFITLIRRNDTPENFDVDKKGRVCAAIDLNYKFLNQFYLVKKLSFITEQYEKKFKTLAGFEPVTNSSEVHVLSN
jgi:hypothetical protein